LKDEKNRKELRQSRVKSTVKNEGLVFINTFYRKRPGIDPGLIA
tara:strand:- start:339 stop:470 length:132 start_codon:yes stop_codon:yes gene_type:complete